METDITCLIVPITNRVFYSDPHDTSIRVKYVDHSVTVYDGGPRSFINSNGSYWQYCPTRDSGEVQPMGYRKTRVQGTLISMVVGSISQSR